MNIPSNTIDPFIRGNAQNEELKGSDIVSESLRRYFGAELLPYLARYPLLRAIGREHQYLLALLDFTERVDAWRRRKPFFELGQALHSHNECREAALFPTCRARPELAYLVDDARGDQRTILANLRELEAKRPDELMWEASFGRLSRSVVEYLWFEARKLLPRAYHVLDEATLRSIEHETLARIERLPSEERGSILPPASLKTG